MSPQESPANSCTRRRILGWGGAGAIGGLACYLGWPESNLKPAPLSEAKLPATPNDSSIAPNPSVETTPQQPQPGMIRREDFLPHLKSAFQLDSKQDCTLTDVGAARKISSPTAGFTSFSLLFTAPADFVSEDRIYQLSHPEMESMDVFLAAVGHSKERVYLEAVFSQRV